LQREFDVAAPPAAHLPPGVNHFQLATRVGDDRDTVPETFITPVQESK
jgi:hypothetical protein